MTDKTAKDPQDGTEWFGDVETTVSDLPRFAMGDPAKDDDPEASIALMQVEGVYEDTLMERIEGKARYLHQIRTRKPIKEDQPRILLWGNAQIDNVLPTLAPGTKVRISYQGVQKLKGKRTMKQIRVEFPANVKRRLSPFANVKQMVPVEAENGNGADPGPSDADYQD